MPSNRLYYNLKPYLPWRLRMAARRFIAHRKRKLYQHVWPIHEAAGRRPEGWPGWPDGKQFAFVLTHDVEGQDGLAKCRQLMELEKELGFRSSFNFVPEGEYRVSREIRDELGTNGFEVGVQDLKHDGKLFQNRESFRRGAKQINHYIQEWGAVGFRSAFMFHNLEWAHDLNIDYSSCTFDTDPFEPQPDGVGTIFPFWVPRPDSEIENQKSKIGNPIEPSDFRPRSPRAGYVELPYTLVQDSTLFLTFCEQTPEIWLRKLDWIVQHGGMALLNVHPDYLRFPGEAAAPSTYPVALYIQLLHYVKERYTGAYSQPLPKEVAAFWLATMPQQKRFLQNWQVQIPERPATL